MLPPASIPKPTLYLFAVLAAFIVASVVGAMWLDFPLLYGAPFAFLLVFQTIVDFRKVFYLLLACIPLSMEIYFPNGLGTDLPTEPLILGLLLVYLFYFAKHFQLLDGRFFRHTINLLLFLHLGWILVAVVNSNLLLVSLKFFLAKCWYVVVFVFMTGLLIKKEEHFKTLFWCVFIPLILTIIYVLVKQYTYGFSFEKIHKSMYPFYRNHVSYAALLSLFFPYIWFARKWYPKRSPKWWLLVISLLVVLVAVQLSYTRAAYVALVMAAGAYFVIRFRFTKLVLGGALIAVLVGFGYVLDNNKYLDYAPNFEKTISHQKFDDLLEATYKMEDISTMERLYRWVAGVKMSTYELWTGFGPGNFYNFYKEYTISSFETYVSDNPEKSGIHNYYLMMLVDQGVMGLIIFLILTFAILIKGEQIYHETKQEGRKRIVMTLLLSLIIIDAFLLINDLIETDKVGSFYFMSIAILINFDLANQDEAHQNVT